MKNNEKSIIVSFSGGLTSAYMLFKILEKCKNSVPVKVVFCNTGLEHEGTLKFVEDCAINWKIDVVWLEAILNDKFFTL